MVTLFRRNKLSRIIIILSILTSTLGVTFTAQASVPQQSEGPAIERTVTITATAEEQLATLSVWTREARAAAQPLALPEVSPDQLKLDESGETLQGVDTAPGVSTSGRPDAQADIVAEQEFQQEWQSLRQELMATQAIIDEFSDPLAIDGTAGVYDSYLANYYSQMHLGYPYRAVGKLYITGGGYCSASVISPNNIIVTAAHCVYDTASNTWRSGWTFVPADRAGAAPYGTFPWASATVLGGWIAAPNSGAGARYDVALIRLGNNSAGRPVTFYTGWLGRSWNFGYVQHHHAVGYPSNLSGGLYTYICSAESFAYATDIMGMGCNMTNGSSGGPWIRVFKPFVTGAVNYVNAVVSFGIPGPTFGTTFYGPRFSTTNIVSLCNTVGC